MNYEDKMVQIQFEKRQKQNCKEGFVHEIKEHVQHKDPHGVNLLNSTENTHKD
jgi:tRNA A37 N6-isopentenylltransferase MiaA